MVNFFYTYSQVVRYHFDQMKNILAYTLSNSNNSRLYVIEHSVYLEDMVSLILGEILDIEWESSKSLGFSSSALSFKQKVQLIQDKKGIDKERIKKLDTILEIRNKFAHVKSINTFQDYFKSSKNAEKNRKQLEKWFEKKQDTEEDPEEQARYNFYLLFQDNFDFLFHLILDHTAQIAKEQTTKEINEEFLNKLKTEVLKSPEANEIWNSTLNKLFQGRREKKE